MNKNHKGFSIVEVLLLFVIVGIIGFVGWYVWSKNNPGTETANVTSQVITTDKKNDQNNIEDPVSKNWKRYDSGLNAYSIKIPDGFKGIRDTSTNLFVFRQYTSTKEPAVVEDVPGWGSDGFSVVSIYQDKKSKMYTSPNALNVNKTEFVTDSGLKGTKTTYDDPYLPPCEGLGCFLGDKHVVYDFENTETGQVVRVWYSRRVANGESKKVYNITADDPDYTKTIDQMVKTLEIQ